VFEAITQVADAIKDLPTAMAKCQALPEEVQAIEDMIKTIKSPRSFFFTVGKNILVNGK